jgi:catechol 2,3-dioxygenase-like lactoylglutathione lyase family enzyme/GNAT superfamily N-acetyltransferase
VQYVIEGGDPHGPDVAELLAASEAHARRLYPAEGVHLLDVSELGAPSVHFLVARSADGVVQGCGAIVIGTDNSAEIKRMFVAPHSRGRGLGSAILRSLEARARAACVRVIRLETGARQPEAIGLYRGFGYRECGPFGQYEPDAHSLFMEKRLDADPMKQSIGYVALVVRDYDEAIHFYVDTLGFHLVEDTSIPAQDKRWVLVAPPGSTGTRLLLARAVGPEQTSHIGDQTGGRVFLFLHTDDFWRDFESYRARGVSFVREPKEESYGIVAVFKDLYGNLWDLLQLRER